MTTLAEGIIASLIAVLLVEAYRFARMMLVFRSQRKAWLLPSRDVTVVAPIFHGDHGLPRQLDLQGGLLSTYDALGISHLLAAGARLRLNMNLQPFDSLPPQGILSGIIVGGPASNLTTRIMMEQFMPNFEPILIDHRTTDLVAESNLNLTGWTCGDRSYEDDKHVGWAFLARLGADVTGFDGIIHICFGLSDIGTAAAAYYLSEHFDKLQKLGDNSYLIAVIVQKQNGYRAVSREYEDLSSAVFTV